MQPSSPSPAASFAPPKFSPVPPRTSCAFPLQLSVQRCHSTLRSQHRRPLVFSLAWRVHRAAFSTSRSFGLLCGEIVADPCGFAPRVGTQCNPPVLGSYRFGPESAPGRDDLCKSVTKSSCLPNAWWPTMHAADLIRLWRKHQ
jgi:hypothetical protein